MCTHRHRAVWAGLHRAVSDGNAAVGSLFAVEACTGALVEEFTSPLPAPVAAAAQRALPHSRATVRR